MSEHAATKVIWRKQMVSLVDFMLPVDRTGSDLAFLLCAVAGTAFFLVKVAMMAFGGSLDGPGHEVDQSPGDTHPEGEGHAFDTFDALKLLSVNSVAAFFAIFGWAGLSAHSQFKLNIFASSAVAIVFGSLAMWLVAYLFHLMRKLTSPGAAFTLDDAVGREAEVYERIPANGRGKVHVTINGMLRELEAESHMADAIDSFVTVKITGVKGQNVIVSPLAN